MPLRCIDLYAGAGGATRGLARAGFRVIAAVENDPLAAASYAANHRDVVLAQSDIREVDAGRLRRFLGLRPGELDLLKACPPCQGFSSLANGTVDDVRNDLVLDVVRFVVEFRPRAILLENVPGLARNDRFGTLLAWLGADDYRSTSYIIDAADFGVPQRRKRLIALAVAPTVTAPLPSTLLEALPSSFDAAPVTAGQALAALAAQPSGRDPLDRHRQPSPAVAARIAAVPVNGNRFDLPPEHQLDCHKRLVRGNLRRTATSSYGRIRADEPAPTMTTRCTTPACGSFIHPTLNRGLTLREAATLQTFPPTYRFVGGHDAVERQIGNAVPVRLAEGLGLAVRHVLDRRRSRSEPSL